VYDPDGYPITVRCVAVWDTVGSLGLSHPSQPAGPNIDFEQASQTQIYQTNSKSLAPQKNKYPRTLNPGENQVLTTTYMQILRHLSLKRN
jgi:hypothetical protein